jgi:hypothetical protein
VIRRGGEGEVATRRRGVGDRNAEWGIEELLQPFDKPFMVSESLVQRLIL